MNNACWCLRLPDGGPHVQPRDHRQAHLRQPEPGGLGWLRAETSVIYSIRILPSFPFMTFMHDFVKSVKHNARFVKKYKVLKMLNQRLVWANIIQNFTFLNFVF